MTSVELSSRELRAGLQRIAPPEVVDLFIAILEGKYDELTSEQLEALRGLEERVGARIPRDRELFLSDALLLARLMGIRAPNPVAQPTLAEVLASQGVSLDQLSVEAREARVKLKILEKHGKWVDTVV